MSVGSHTEWFTVRGYEVNEDNRLKLQCLSDYLQEAAGVHAAHLGLSLERLQAEGVTWVLSRFQFAPEYMPLAGTRLAVETWPVGVEGLQYRRDFRVVGEDGTLVARAVSHWVVVNFSTRRVGRVPAFIAEIALDNAETVMDLSRAKLPALAREEETCRFTVRLADMDRNRHVNNVRYMDWILESVPDSVRDGRVPVFLEMSYKAESLRRDVVSARIRPDAVDGEREDCGNCAGEESASFCHALVRDGDDRELVRGRSIWRVPGA